MESYELFGVLGFLSARRSYRVEPDPYSECFHYICVSAKIRYVQKAMYIKNEDALCKVKDAISKFSLSLYSKDGIVRSLNLFPTRQFRLITRVASETNWIHFTIRKTHYLVVKTPLL